MAGPAFEALRTHGLAFPEAEEDFPWGHTALKVRGKSFAWLDESDGALSLTVKLPASRDFALVFDFAAPAGYGLGRSGWISCRFGAGETPDLDLLQRWLAESYRAVAPKKLAALLPEED
ncbi:MAG: MmcQ/YjbR family DNA-binding protein [Sphingomonadaceae bacterium]|nr:MmcQ/YjbR family DNA-binding protein [Sphingomonadaceae bacterium]